MPRISSDTLQFLRRAVNGPLTTNLRPHHCLRQPATSPCFPTTPRRQYSDTPSTATKAEQSHYDLFPQSMPKGAPPAGKFAIDLRALKREFLKLQASAHPDRHPQGGNLNATAHSARINDAYKTLLDPLKRAQYLLSSRGVGGGEDDEGTLGEGQGDMEILMEVMEAREAAEEAEGEEEVRSLREENRRRIEDVVERLGRAFEEDDLDTAKTMCIRLRYWVGVEDRLREGNSMHQ